MEIVVADIGGTHARFALAEVADGRVTALGAETVLKTAAHASLEAAWAAFAAARGRALPRAACFALAGPVQGELLKLTNNPWEIWPARLPSALGLDRSLVVNDFGAVAHAAAQLPPAHLRHLSGPDRPLAHHGMISVVGPGTGLGVAAVLRLGSDAYHVIETEGGHTDFAPLDPFEDALLERLRARFDRVSAERIVSGPGLRAIYETVAAGAGCAPVHGDDQALWQAALARSDSLAAAALERFCSSLGAVAGDIALAQGARGVVIAGGLGLRLAERLAGPEFGARFIAKGRFQDMMAQMPVKLITHPQPGLFGAAAAFAREHAQ